MAQIYMGEQFWWFYDVVAVAAILVCIFITVKKGLLKAAFSLVGYVLAIAIAISLSSSIAGSIYEKSVKESNIKKMDQALTEREFNGELAKYLESLGYNIYVDRDRLETICEKGEKVDENLYNYVNNINGKKVDEEAIFYNKLHEGYATVMSGIISRHLSEYSAEYAAVQIEGDPLKFCEFMKLLEDKESMRAPAEFIVENYLGKPYRSQVRLITLLALLVIFILITVFISSSAGRNDNMEPGVVSHLLSGLIGAFKGCVIVFAIAVMVRLYVIFGSNKMLFFNHDAIDQTYLFKFVYDLVKNM